MLTCRSPSYCLVVFQKVKQPNMFAFMQSATVNTTCACTHVRYTLIITVAVLIHMASFGKRGLRKKEHKYERILIVHIKHT